MRYPGYAAALVLISCGGVAELEKDASGPSVPDVSAQLAKAEDARDATSEAFRRASGSSDPDLRRRAAVGWGRVLKPEGVDPLIALARDPAALVRRTALFSLGQYGWAPAATRGREQELLAAASAGLREAEETVRQRAVEAVGKLGMEETPRLVLPYLKDPSAVVRAEAVTALFRWHAVWRHRHAPEDRPPPLSAEAIEALGDAAADPAEEVRWRVAHVYSRVPEAARVEALLKLAKDGNPWCRVFAVTVLGRQKDKAYAGVVADAQSDSESAVRTAALKALGLLDRPDLIRHALASDPSWHVRAAVAESLGSSPARDEATLAALAADASPAVREAALVSRTRMRPLESREEVAEALSSRHVATRLAGVKAARSLGALGMSFLERALRDRDERVRGAVLEAFGSMENNEGAARGILAGLRAESVTERAAAVEALGRRRDQEAARAARECYRASMDRRWIEVREMLVEFLGRFPEMTEFLQEIVASDPAPSVRMKAASARRPGEAVEAPDTGLSDLTRSPYADLRFQRNPVVVLDTTQGVLEIECHAREAPIHAANFVGLAEAGFYDGLPWHRVVSNFVIQGGDPLGSGWGDAGWNLRAEINEHRYVRGTVGMPRSAGFDTGGCQLFITHLPAPHLDGLYTVFGQVVRGLDVVDRIEPWDVIKRATVRK
ncbi:MAG: HEAT repeat domain-containing protein [Planctomycetes bacterium]|nr:HEAT repeat domain-containing protein [Planctomycetota bacterium]